MFRTYKEAELRLLLNLLLVWIFGSKNSLKRQLKMTDLWSNNELGVLFFLKNGARHFARKKRICKNASIQQQGQTIVGDKGAVMVRQHPSSLLDIRGAPTPLLSRSISAVQIGLPHQLHVGHNCCWPEAVKQVDIWSKAAVQPSEVANVRLFMTIRTSCPLHTNQQASWRVLEPYWPAA